MEDGEDGEDATWPARRRAAAAAQGERLAAAQAQEDQRARALVEDFTARAVAAGLPTRELRAVDAGGWHHRTGVQGWLLRRDGRSGVGLDGAFYLLAVPAGAAARLSGLVRGVRLVPSQPPLVMGRGGRDGESVALADLLERRLAEGGG